MVDVLFTEFSLNRDASHSVSSAPRSFASSCWLTDVPATMLRTQKVHDHYARLHEVERDFCTLQTGLLEARPVFMRKQGRRPGQVVASPLALTWWRETELLRRAVFGATETQPQNTLSRL
jgi:hypothetical protein